jgi:hypothetical protein
VHTIYGTVAQHCRDIYASASAELCWRRGEVLLQRQSNCETLWTLKVILTLGCTLGIIPTHTQAITKLQTFKAFRPKKSTSLEYNQTCKHSDTRKRICHTPQARFHGGGFVRNLVCPLSYSDSLVYNQKIELTYTCTVAYTEESFYKSFITNRQS